MRKTKKKTAVVFVVLLQSENLLEVEMCRETPLVQVLMQQGNK
jgi:hypothetical protein